MERLKLSRIEWGEAAEVFIAAAMKHEKMVSVDSLKRIVVMGYGELWGGFIGAELIGAFITRRVREDRGVCGWIVAGGGKLKQWGLNYFRDVLPLIEQQLSDCNWIATETYRPGIVRGYAGEGYERGCVVMMKGMGHGCNTAQV